MGKLVWLLLGGLGLLVVSLLSLAGEGGRGGPAIGSPGDPGGGGRRGGALDGSTAVELVLASRDEPEPGRGRAFDVEPRREPPPSSSGTHERGSGLDPGGDAAPLAIDPQHRRRNAPPPRPKWTQAPELEEYHDNGQLHFRALQVRDEKGTWRREGPWEAWHENGQLHEVGAYLRGREQGKWSWWYDNGQRMAEGQFTEGERTGGWTFWHEDGSLMIQGGYRNGKGAGRWTYYDESGEALKHVEFEGGLVRHVEWL